MIDTVNMIWKQSVPTSRRGAAMEGEVSSRPPSAVRKDDGLKPIAEHWESSVCLPADEQTLVLPPTAVTPLPQKLCVSAPLR